MTQDERRRQLVGIGLRMLVERPIQDLAVDEVAREAGISRGLLFHYFPNKTAFHDAVVAAAGRRVVRNTAPDEDRTGWDAVTQFAERYFEQVDRRRASYAALVFGGGPVTLDGARVEGLRETMGARVRALLGAPDAAAPVTDAWTAYVEARALRWAAVPDRERVTDPTAEADHCVRALRALLDLD
ncbi:MULTISPECIES: TetR/AcrR family transcriptional regulator [unclassified Nocardiopsis]|uniref:TetR/AcrR family transcriptional regulator n=1 Tax=unclassified Nocardiopsis TaxID=2649073 RepID=UPI00066BD729|nr:MULTISPECIES: TetR/AcrR family transcriptional regulator [unclassified Nocardiopsis]MBQ1080433.1 TetR/AcrR family transcriptional regulator [Nocardiopsis sp. B62]